MDVLNALDDAAKFWSRVEVRPGCWLWTGFIMPNGYGKLGTRYAHRLAYELFVGPIPQGLVIDHLCRVRSCVNPAHLEPVTSGENTRRGRTGEASKLRAARQTHCKRGHLRSPENLYVFTGGDGRTRNYCRLCRMPQAVAS